MSIPKRNLGASGLEVSQLGFGCMRLPLNSSNPADVNASLAVSMIRQAIDAGVNYVDTAYPYHSNDHTRPGQNELVTAQALADGYRDKVLLATKLPLWLVQTRTDMNRILDDQLRRLDTPYLDIYLAHNVNEGIWPKMEALGIHAFFDGALKDGRIRHAGFSFHDRYPLFEEVLAGRDWSMAQIQYNYLDVEHQAGIQGLKLAAKRGVGVVIMEPLRGGFLVNNLPDEGKLILRAARPEWSLAEWALRWVWDQPEVSAVLSGMSTMAQVEENVRLAAATETGNLTGGDKAALDQVRRLFMERIKVGCTACGYCLPCPCGVAIPKIFSLYNEFHFTDDAQAQQIARYFYLGIMGEDQPASACVGCGECLEKCPQHIDIPAEMGKAAAVFHP